MTISVHLQNFPNLQHIVVDKQIVDKMDEVREICNCVFSLRKEANIRVRMPLKKIVIYGKIDLDDSYLDIIKQEVNTREIVFFNGNLDDVVTKDVLLNMKECGSIFGSKLKDILIAQKNRQWEIVDDKLNIAGFSLDKSLFTTIYSSKDGSKMLPCEKFNLLVSIDTEQDRDLVIEGLARDLVRIIQQSRKDEGLKIDDRINVVIYNKDDILVEVLSLWKDYICDQTLAKSIEIDAEHNKKDDNNEFIIDEYKISIQLTKVDILN